MAKSVSSQRRDDSITKKSRVWKSQALKALTDSFSVLATTERTQFAVMVLQAGETSGEYGNEHADSDQWLLVLEGNGEVLTEEGKKDVATGDIVLVPAPEKHRFKCTGSSPLRTVSIYGPPAYDTDEHQ